MQFERAAPGTAEIRGGRRKPVTLQPFSYGFGISLADLELFCVGRTQDRGAAGNLHHQPARHGSRFAESLDQEVYTRVREASWFLCIRALSITAGQQDVGEATDFCLWVIAAHPDARPQPVGD